MCEYSKRINNWNCFGSRRQMKCPGSIRDVGGLGVNMNIMASSAHSQDRSTRVLGLRRESIPL